MTSQPEDSRRNSTHEHLKQRKVETYMFYTILCKLSVAEYVAVVEEGLCQHLFHCRHYQYRTDATMHVTTILTYKRHIPI
jgi:hypothetical protein